MSVRVGLHESQWPTVASRNEVLSQLRAEWLRPYRDRHASCASLAQTGAQAVRARSYPPACLPNDVRPHLAWAWSVDPWSRRMVGA